MNDFENSVAVLDREIEHRSLKVLDLEKVVALKKLETSNREKRDLMGELKNKDKELLELRDRLQTVLKTLNENQTELNKIKGLERTGWCCNLKVNSNEEVLNGNDIRIRDRNEVPINKVKIKDNVYQREASSNKINISQNIALQHPEREIRRLGIELKEKDGQLFDQMERAEQTLKKLRQTEIELGEIITSLKSKNRLLEEDMDQYNLDKKHLQKLLHCKTTEIKYVNELLAKELKKSDELRYQLKQVLKENAGKGFESDVIIPSLQMKIQELEREIIQTKEKNKFLEMAVKDRNDQLRQNRNQLTDTLNKLHQKEIDFCGVINSLKRKHQTDIEERDIHVKDLKEELDSIMSATNERHERLLEKQLSEMRYHQQEELNQFHDKEEQLKATVNSLNTVVQQMQKEKKGHNLKVTLLQEMLDNANSKIRNTSEQPEHNLLEEQDEQLSNLTDQLQNTLKQIQETETELDGVISSQRKRIQHLETEAEEHVQTIANLNKILGKNNDTITEMSESNKHFENKVNEKDEQIRIQNARLNCTLERLHETETELGTLERKLQVHEADIEQRDLKLKDMDAKLASMRSEIIGGNKLNAKQMKKNEKLLSEQKNQLQQVVSLSQEKEAELSGRMSSLKKQNLFLEAQVERCDLKVKHLENLLDNKSTEIVDSNRTVKEKDNQISELKDQLQHTFRKLDCKEFETKENDTSLTKKIDYLELEVEHHRRNKTHLGDVLKSTKLELNQLRDRNELIENKMKEKDNQLREQGDQLNRSLKTLQEKVTELDGTIAILRKKNKDLETDMERRNVNVKELEEQLDSLKAEKMEGNEILVRQVDEKDKLQQVLNKLYKNETDLNEIITSLKKQNQTKDNQLSELKDRLKQALNKIDYKEAEKEELDISLKKEMKHIEKEVERREQTVKNLEEMLNRNILLENKLKEKDEQNYQLKRTLKELQVTESRLVATISSIETKNQGLETDVERRDLKVKDLEEMLESTKAEISGEYERLEKHVHEKNKQLSEQRNQLQQVQTKVSKLNDEIVLLKTQNKEKDDQISDLRDQLQQALKNLDNREAEFNETGDLQKKNLRYLESELKQREQNVRHLKEVLNGKTVEMKQMIENNILLESMLKGKDKQLHKQSDQLNRASEALQEKETELGGIIKTLKKKCHGLETDIEHRDQQLHDLEKKLDKSKSDKSGNTEIHVKEVNQITEKNYRLQQAVNQLQKTEVTLNEVIATLKKQNQDKDNQIFEHRDQLKTVLDQLSAKKADTEENDMLLKKKINNLEAELERHEQNLKSREEILNKNELLENKLKEKDEQNYQLKRTLKELQETESRLVATITAIKTKNQGLETDVERRDLKVKNLEEILESTKAEISVEYKRLENNVYEKDKQLFEQKNQLQQVQEKVCKQNDIIILLQTQNKEKDDQISDLRDQLQQALKRLDNREAEFKETDDLQTKNLRYLESELKQREQNVRHLKEMLNGKTVEMKQMTENNILLESMLKEKDNQLHEQSDQLNHASEALQEKITGLGGIIKTLKKKCHGLETDIGNRDQQLHDLEKELDKLKTDKSGRKEHHVKEVNQITEKNCRLQRAVNELQKTEATLNEVIATLKKQIHEKDNQIFQHRDRLAKALDQLSDKKAETEENDMLLKKKIKNLEVELERREHKSNKQEEIINSNNTEITEMRYKYERLEKMMKDKDDALRVQASQWRQEIQKLEREVELRDRKVNNMEKTLQSKNSETKDKDVREKDRKIVELKDQLKTSLTKLHDIESELDETKTRLSKAMGDRLTDNNPNITDLSDRNRPTKLAERCAELYDNQWTDAFDILDKYYDTEENVIEALLLILQDSMTFCITKAREQMEVLGRELKFTDQHGNGDASADVRKLLKDCRKAVAPVAVGNLYKMYVTHLRRSTDKALRTALEVSSYTTECLEICWFMVIQDPPVAFAPLLRKGSSFNTDLYKPYTSSGTHIDYVVWPPLVLHEGGPILAKGVAQGYGKKSKKSTS